MGLKQKIKNRRIDKKRCKNGHRFIRGEAFNGFFFADCADCPTKQFSTQEKWEQLPEE